MNPWFIQFLLRILAILGLDVKETRNEKAFQACQIVKAQAKRLKTDAVFRCICDNEFENFVKELEAAAKRTSWETMLLQRGNAGETIVHLCFLYCRYQFAKHVIKMAKKHDLLASVLFSCYANPEMLREDENGVLFVSEVGPPPTSPGQYTGETCLHIATVNRAFHMVQYLLQEMLECEQECHRRGVRLGEAARLTGRLSEISSVAEFLQYAVVTGTFFSPGGGVYFGDTVYHFAACRGDRRILDFIYEVGGDPDTQDSYMGNTALHLMVIHSRCDMYEHVRITHDGDPAVQNAAGLTPFVLAARLGHYDSFDSILEAEQMIIWVFGPVSCKAYPLEGLDTWSYSKSDDQPCSVARQRAISISQHLGLGKLSHRFIQERPSIFRLKQSVSALEEIVYHRHYELLKHHVVMTLLDDKWEKFGRKMFIGEMISYGAYMVVFSLALTMRPSAASLSLEEYTNDEVWIYDSPKQYIRLVLEVVSVVIAVIWVIQDIRSWMVFFWLERIVRILKLRRISIFPGDFQLIEMVGIQNLHKAEQNGFTIAFLLLRRMFFGYVILGSIARIARWEDVELWSFAIAALLGWVYMVYYGRGYQLTGKFVIMIYEMLVGDFLRFMIFFCLFVMAFSLSFFVLWYGSSERRLYNRIMQVFTMMLGDFNYVADFESSEYGLTSSLIFILFHIMVTILLLNLLIAMFSDTYSSVHRRADSAYHLERARIILQIEKCLKRDNPEYWSGDDLKGDLGRYLIVEEKIEEVDTDSDESGDERDGWEPPASLPDTARSLRRKSQLSVHTVGTPRDLGHPEAGRLVPDVVSGASPAGSPMMSFQPRGSPLHAEEDVVGPLRSKPASAFRRLSLVVQTKALLNSATASKAPVRRVRRTTSVRLPFFVKDEDSGAANVSPRDARANIRRMAKESAMEDFKQKMASVAAGMDTITGSPAVGQVSEANIRTHLTSPSAATNPRYSGSTECSEDMSTRTKNNGSKGRGSITEPEPGGHEEGASEYTPVLPVHFEK
eukprot:Rmarinus@m.23772